MTKKTPHRRAGGSSQTLIIALASVLLTGSALGAESSPVPTPRGHLMSLQLPAADGAALYENICQACHMQGGTGATGAADYPALAKNRRLAVKGYPIQRVLDGSKAMPPFKEMLTDEQIAAVVSYVRTHFGNSYKDPVKGSDVRALRQ